MRNSDAPGSWSSNGNQAPPYVGLLVAATPRLVRLRAVDIELAADGPERIFAL